MIKVGELFAGIGSQTQALKNIGIEHNVEFISEIDKYAVKSYEAIHGEVNNLGDIKEIDKIPYVDLLTYSFPCQDLSVAGKQAGIQKHTRSGLLYEVERLLNISEKPKYLLLENVKNLIGKKHKADFDEWLKTLEKMGYHNYWKVLNAKDYGIPQNRERVFVVSSLEKIDYEFPEKEELKLKLKDMLENKVDEKFYIKKELSENLIKKVSEKEISKTIRCGGKGSLDLKHEWDLVGIKQVGMLNIKGNEQIRRVYSQDGISPTLSTMQGGNRQPKIIIGSTQKNAAINKDGISPTLTSAMGCGGGQVPTHNYYNKIRKLTPLECWRLMGFKDDQFYKAEKVNSNTQLYKQAGNSIVVNVLESIFKELLK